MSLLSAARYNDAIAAACEERSMVWPVPQDYNEAVQNPEHCFADPELRAGEAVTDAFGIPRPRSGNFADVYQVRCPGGDWAAKCFTREVRGLHQRYAAVSAHLQQARLPFTVEFQYLEQGVRVGAGWFPLLKMRWVEGFALNEFVRDNLDRPALLEALLQIWVRMAKRLREADVAHGDLQHGNVLLVPGSSAQSLAVRLIDYDGLWVPALAQSKSGEIGHPNYQHPQRLREQTYGPEVDRFPLLVVAAALRCLQVGGRALWEKYDNGDNLLFKEADFSAPHQSPLFAELLQLGDATARSAAARLMAAAQKPLEETPLLEEVFSEKPPAIPAPPPAADPRPVSFVQPAARATQRQVVRLRRHLTPRLPMRSALPLVIALLVPVLVGGGVAFWAMQGGSPPTSRGPRDTLVAVNPETRPITKTTSRTHPADSRTKPPTTDKPRDTQPAVAAPPNTEPVIPATPVSTAPAKPPEPPMKVADRPEGRSPIPAEADLAAAEKEVKEIHKEEYAKRKPAEVLALARQLLSEGVETKDRPAVQFVLLREARDLAARAGDISLAFVAAGELSNRFQVVAEETKAAVLEAASRAATTGSARLTIAAAALLVADDAVEIDQYPVAERLVKLAQTMTTSSAHPIASAAAGRVKEVAALRRAHEEAQPALARLDAAPDDPAANLAAGTFYALVKGDWDRGLELLSRGSDEKLKALAEADLTCAASGEAAVELAERYLAQAAAQSDTARTHLQFRAHYWYERARSRFAGVERTRIERKMAALESELPEARPVVLQAHFGAYNGWGDVTDKVRGQLVLARGQKLSIKVSLDLFGIPDPCFGEYKTLVVLYRYRGGTRLGITGDAATAAIPEVPGPPDRGPAKPAPGQELLILAARYGNQGTFADVTDKVQTTVQGRTAVVDPAKVDLGDPYPFRHKALVIAYRDGSKVRLSLTRQETAATLGTPR
jgi:hypothetical protein